MLISYFRSSSYNRWDMCQLQYFIEYNLGWFGASGKAAVKGTTVHKVLEVMALIKKAQQEGKKSAKDDVLGRIKENYNLDRLIEKAYKYYSEGESHIDWKDADFKDVKKWTYLALSNNEGEFDPRNREIWAVEPFFDFQVDDLFGIKGTIDLIMKVDDKTLEVNDWKTGQRKDWATGEKKDYAKLMVDPQLRLYYYAVHLLYPEFEKIIVTINYINDGGPFTMCFGKEDLEKTRQMLRERFYTIRECQKPTSITSGKDFWKCKYLCGAGKTTFEQTNIIPLQEFRRNKKTKYGDVMSKCEQVRFDLGKHDMDYVIEKYTRPGFNVSYYKDPGVVG